MFQFTRLLLTDLCIQSAAVGNPGIIACLSAPPGISQTSTPFILSMPRHPPCALGNLAVEIPNSDKTTHPGKPKLAIESKDINFNQLVTNDITFIANLFKTPPQVKLAAGKIAINNSHRILDSNSNHQLHRFRKSNLAGDASKEHCKTPRHKQTTTDVMTSLIRAALLFIQMPITKQPNCKKTVLSCRSSSGDTQDATRKQPKKSRDSPCVRDSFGHLRSVFLCGRRRIQQTFWSVNRVFARKLKNFPGLFLKGSHRLFAAVKSSHPNHWEAKDCKLAQSSQAAIDSFPRISSH